LRLDTREHRHHIWQRVEADDRVVRELVEGRLPAVGHGTQHRERAREHAVHVRARGCVNLQHEHGEAGGARARVGRVLRRRLGRRLRVLLLGGGGHRRDIHLRTVGAHALRELLRVSGGVEVGGREAAQPPPPRPALLAAAAKATELGRDAEDERLPHRRRRGALVAARR